MLERYSRPLHISIQTDDTEDDTLYQQILSFSIIIGQPHTSKNLKIYLYQSLLYL